jgi:hypothetical protein
MNEAKGVAWTTLWRNGIKINVTHRSDEGSSDALNQLWGTIEVAMQNGYGIGDDTPRQPVARTTDGKDWGLQEYAPKASELGFGDTFEVVIDEYSYDGSEVRFYGADDEYPKLTHNMTAEYPRKVFDEIFKGWQPDEGSRIPFPKGAVVLEVECSTKPNKAGNPYRNLVGIHRPEEN